MFNKGKYDSSNFSVSFYLFILLFCFLWKSFLISFFWKNGSISNIWILSQLNLWQYSDWYCDWNYSVSYIWFLFYLIFLMLVITVIIVISNTGRSFVSIIGSYNSEPNNIHFFRLIIIFRFGMKVLD